jgi:hypothetical protein
MSPAVVAIHILLVLVGAFLLGTRIYGETQPRSAADDADARQLRRITTYASVGMFVLLVALVVGLDLMVFHVAGAMK